MGLFVVFFCAPGPLLSVGQRGRCLDGLFYSVQLELKEPNISAVQTFSF